MEQLPWGEILAGGGINAVLSFVVYKLWNQNNELQQELRDTHKEQAEFWREVAHNMEVK